VSLLQNTIALIFDFDDTLTDDSTTRLLDSYGVDTKDFWEVKVKARVKAGWDPTLAWLDLILERVGDGKPLGNLSNEELRQFGASLKFYKGLPALFPSLRKLVSKFKISKPTIEFYIISGGLEEIIRGSKLSKYFDGIWGCQFEEKDGRIAKIKRAISFTEKTKYLFYISKGLAAKANGDPYSVNKEVPESKRPIPFYNMIYVGDGLTDVPCFSLLKKGKGWGFGVFDPKKKGSPKTAWQKLVAPERVMTMNSPRYRQTDDLGALIRAAVSDTCVALDLKTQQALS
jgi:phosphoserine phosphatase